MLVLFFGFGPAIVRFSRLGHLAAIFFGQPLYASATSNWVFHVHKHVLCLSHFKLGFSCTQTCARFVNLAIFGFSDSFRGTTKGDASDCFAKYHQLEHFL